MSISEKIAVMKYGVIKQIGTPQEVYQRPANVFVAKFIGRTNIIERKVKAKNGKYYLYLDKENRFGLPSIDLSESDQELDVKLSVRPEEFVIVPESEEGIKIGRAHV